MPESIKDVRNNLNQILPTDQSSAENAPANDREIEELNKELYQTGNTSRSGGTSLFTSPASFISGGTFAQIRPAPRDIAQLRDNPKPDPDGMSQWDLDILRSINIVKKDPGAILNYRDVVQSEILSSLTLTELKDISKYLELGEYDMLSTQQWLRLAWSNIPQSWVKNKEEMMALVLHP